MYIPLTVTTNEHDDPTVYKRLIDEMTNILAEVKQIKVALINGEVFDKLNPNIADEIRNLDTTQVTIELTRNDAGNLWLHLWNK